MEELENYVEEIASINIGSVALGTIISAILVFAVCFVIIHVISTLIHRAFFKEKRMGKVMHSFFESVIKIVMWVIASIIIADVLGIPTTSLVAVISVIGLALSLSIQNIMSNLFSGLTLLITKPCGVGDYVDISGKMGVVRSVGLFYTVLTTLDNVRVSIPNGDVTAAAVINYSGEHIRRLDQFYCASYDIPTETVKTAILEAAKGDPRILTDPAPFASISDYKESSIEYTSRVWVDPKDYWDVKLAMNERVRESFAKHGVVMTYNHINVHFDKDTLPQLLNRKDN